MDKLKEASSRYSDRCRSPEDTLALVTPYLKEYGVTRLGRVTGLDNIGIPVWTATVPNSKTIVINQGKGIRDIDAKVSAAMEALERAVACQPFVASRRSTAQALQAEGQACLFLPELIAAGQADLGADDAIDWLPGFDLHSNKPIWAPLEAALLDRTHSNSQYWQSSDGLASGNTFTEAVLHGLLERIERDAEVLWRLSSAARLACCIDPHSFGDAVLDGLIGKITDAGLRLQLFDITSDIGIPCFAAFLAHGQITAMTHLTFTDVTAGYGAHPDCVRAAIRAVTEAAQSRLTYISGARDDVFPEMYTQPLPAEVFVCFQAVAQVRDYDRRDWAALNVDDLLSHVLACLLKAGINSVAAVALSDDSVPFSVAKIFASQLESPDGARKRRIGMRALRKSMVSS